MPGSRGEVESKCFLIDLIKVETDHIRCATYMFICYNKTNLCWRTHHRCFVQLFHCLISSPETEKKDWSQVMPNAKVVLLLPFIFYISPILLFSITSCNILLYCIVLLYLTHHLRVQGMTPNFDADNVIEQIGLNSELFTKR